MNVSNLSVRRGVTFGSVYLIVLGFGLFSLSRLNLDLFPDISFPAVVVITTYTGSSPEDMETLITRPIESAVATVKDVEGIESESKNGVSVVTVEFDWDRDMDQAETDVRRALELNERMMPEDADDPMVFAFDPAMQPIFLMMITGPYPQDEMRQIAEDEIQPRFERLPGIASVEVAGGLEREIHVVLDPVKVEAFGLDPAMIVGSVYRENAQLPGGSLEQGSLDFTIQTKGKYQTVKEIGEVVVGMKRTNGAMEPLRLKEVTRVEDSFYESQRILEVDGEPTVWLIVRKQSGANTVKASQGVWDAMPKIQEQSGADVKFSILWDQADFIRLSLGNLSTTALAGILISFLVLLFFLRNIRSALIVASAIPLSVIATFFVMDRADMTLNIFSMAGLALAVGLLVDNAIVVLENIFRLRQEGKGGWDSAIQGAQGVGTAVTASTLTTISVFVPVLFVPGIAGVIFRDMAVTICFALAVSLIVALTFIPLAASRLLGSERATRLLERAHSKDFFSRFREWYGRRLDWALRHRWVVGVSLLGLIGATVAIATALPTEFVTEDDNSQLFVQIETPIGNNLQETAGIVREAADRVAKVVKPEERKFVAIDVGTGKGFIAIFSKGVHAGLIRVPLVSMGSRARSQAQIEDAVREEMKKMAGVKVTIGDPFNPMGGEGDIEIQIRGHDLETSRRIGLDLQQKLRAWPEMAWVNYSMDDQKPEVRVRFDRSKMADLGLSTAAVGGAVQTFFMGKMAGRFSDGGDEYDILVRYDRRHRLDVGELRRMPVVTPAGASLPLQNIADIDVGLGPVDITRMDQERVTKLLCELKDEYKYASGEAGVKDLGRSKRRVEELLEAYSWPDEFTHHVGGTAEDFADSFKWLGVAMAVAILLVYMVMASQFESLRQPFIIIFSVPLAFIGVVLMFTLTGSKLDVSALVGVIMLVGIVVNNAIVMIDAANQFRLQGLDRREAISRASRLRFRPVLMTSLTTIMAMTPLALELGEGSAGWGAMAKAVIGGLLVASALTLFVVPTMYTLFARKTVRHAEKLQVTEGGAS